MEKPHSRQLVADLRTLSADLPERSLALSAGVLSPEEVQLMLKDRVLPLAELLTPMLKELQQRAPEITEIQAGVRGQTPGAMVGQAHRRLHADRIDKRKLPQIFTDEIENGFTAKTVPPDNDARAVSISFQQAKDGAIDIGVSRMKYPATYDTTGRQAGSIPDLTDFAFSVSINPETGEIRHATIMHASISREVVGIERNTLSVDAQHTLAREAATTFESTFSYIETGVGRALEAFRLELKKVG